MNDVSNNALNASSERAAMAFSGYVALALMLAALGWGAFAVIEMISRGEDHVAVSDILHMILAVLVFVLLWAGFYMIQPNQGVSITLFGAYRGTDRNEGLRWVWPWMGKAKVSLRANNLISEKIKVNDLRGNPIEMAAQVVWRVTDTAQALLR
jgi:regulator of protease activity HflC (stomatin/prohibitin superfamily)